MIREREKKIFFSTISTLRFLSKYKSECNHPRFPLSKDQILHPHTTYTTHTTHFIDRIDYTMVCEKSEREKFTVKGNLSEISGKFSSAFFLLLVILFNRCIDRQACYHLPFSPSKERKALIVCLEKYSRVNGY